MMTAQDDDTKRIRASYRIWAGGAIIGLALLAFGLIRPDDGTVPFLVLLVQPPDDLGGDRRDRAPPPRLSARRSPLLIRPRG